MKHISTRNPTGGGLGFGYKPNLIKSVPSNSWEVDSGDLEILEKDEQR